MAAGQSEWMSCESVLQLPLDPDFLPGAQFGIGIEGMRGPCSQATECRLGPHCQVTVKFPVE